MHVNSTTCREIIRLSDHTGELRQLGQCNDDDRIDRAFSAVCKRIWGYTLDDFDDESLSPRDHAFLDRLTWQQAQNFALASGYDLVDPAGGDMVPDWWGFAWMIMAEKRGLLTPKGRAAAWRRYAERLRAEPKIAGMIRWRA